MNNQLIHKNKISLTVLLLVSLLCLSSQAFSARAVGIVTNVEGDVVNQNENRAVDFGDDAIQTNKIKIGDNSSLILTYYAGCRQEWYGANTTIEIGLNKSKLINGKLDKTDNFDCEVPEVVLDEKDSFKKAAFHFRSIGLTKKDKTSKEATPEKIHTSSVKTKTWGNNSKNLKLRMWTAKKEGVSYRTGEQIIIYFVANKDAYIKLDYFTVDGNVVHLVPNLFEGKTEAKAGQIYVIGGNKSKIKLAVEKPYGKETIRALVSLKPFDKQLNTKNLVENANVYKNKQRKLLLAQKNNRIDQYTLELKTEH